MTTTLERTPTVEADTNVATAPHLAPSEQFERYDTIDTPKIAIVGFISAILTFVVIVAAQAIFFAADNALDQRRNVAATDSTSQQAITQQEAQLNSYGWVDSEKGIVQIPIDAAMDQVVREQSAAAEAD